jgi:uncharacterized repeat protein (TIGR02543 family)
MKKRILSTFMAFIMVVSVIAIPESGFIIEAEASTFTVRTTAPRRGNTNDDRFYFSNENLFHRDGGVLPLPNCTTYAWGRAFEVLGYQPLKLGTRGTTNITLMASSWFNEAIINGFETGQTPRAGAIACWGTGNHVAFVERINGNQITITDSRWRDWNVDQGNIDTTWGTWTGTLDQLRVRFRGFQGFIYLPISGGGGTTCTTHDWSNRGFCTRCNTEFSIHITPLNPHQIFSATPATTANPPNTVPVRNRPYAADTTIRTLARGAEVTVTASGFNSEGNLWYRLNTGEWVYSGRLTFVRNVTTTVLTAPTGLTAAWATNSTARVSWNAVSGAASYEVEFRRTTQTHINANWQRDWDYTNRTATSYNPTLTAGVTYEFRVRAVNSAGQQSGWSAVASYTHTSGAPGLAVSSTLSGRWTITIPANTRVNLFSTPTGTSAVESYSARSSPFTLEAIRRLTMNDGSTRFHIQAPTNGVIHDYYFVLINSMTVVERIYTVDYNANGGSSAPAAQTKRFGVNLTLSSAQPTRAGFDFLGWATSSTATTATYQPGATYTANANLTLWAVWRAHTYPVTFNANGGTGAPAAQAKTHGTNLTLSNIQPTRAGFNFLGWAASPTATTPTHQPGSTYASNARLTLYAVWEALVVDIPLNVRVDGNIVDVLIDKNGDYDGALALTLSEGLTVANVSSPGGALAVYLPDSNKIVVAGIYMEINDILIRITFNGSGTVSIIGESGLEGFNATLKIEDTPACADCADPNKGCPGCGYCEDCDYKLHGNLHCADCKWCGLCDWEYGIELHCAGCGECGGNCICITGDEPCSVCENDPCDCEIINEPCDTCVNDPCNCGVAENPVPVPVVAIPTVSPANLTFASSVNVTLATETEGAVIYYTVNGATPTTDSARYTAPFLINATSTIRAIAIKEGMADSEVLTVTFTRSSGNSGSTGGGGSGGGGGSSGSTTPPSTPTPQIQQTPGITNIIVNMPVTIINTINVNIPVVQLKVPAGATGNQSISVGREFIGQNAVLVRYNAATGELEFVSAATVGANGNANINVRESGDFLVQTFKTGDITGTGEVETSDALALLRHVAGISELNSIQLFVANGSSGDVATSDALNILRYIAGIIDKI